MLGIWVASFGGALHAPVTTYFQVEVGASTVSWQQLLPSRGAGAPFEAGSFLRHATSKGDQMDIDLQQRNAVAFFVSG